MNYAEGQEASLEARRCPRYEIDTEIHVATFGKEKQEIVLRSLIPANPSSFQR
jgi:hypothetical protein